MWADKVHQNTTPDPNRRKAKLILRQNPEHGNNHKLQTWWGPVR